MSKVETIESLIIIIKIICSSQDFIFGKQSVSDLKRRIGTKYLNTSIILDFQDVSHFSPKGFRGFSEILRNFYLEQRKIILVNANEKIRKKLTEFDDNFFLSYDKAIKSLIEKK